MRSYLESAWLRLVVACVSFGLLVAAARGLTEVGFANFAYVLSVALLVGGLASVGLPGVVIREVPQLRVRGELSLVEGLYSSAIHIAWRSAFVGACCALLLVWARVGFGATAVLGAALTGCITLNLVTTSALRAFENLRWALIPSEIAWRSGLVAVLAIAWGFSVTVSVDALLFVGVVALGASFFGQRRKFVHLSGSGEAPTQWPLTVSTLLKVWLGTALGGAIPHLILVAAGLAFDDGRLAPIVVAFRSASLVSLPLQAAVILGGARFARGVAIDLDTAQRSLNEAVLAASVPAIPIAAFLLLWPELFLGLFGQFGDETVGLLTVFVLANLVNVLSGISGPAMLMLRHEIALSAFVGVAVVVPLTLLALTTPDLGHAAIMLSMMLVTWNVLSVLYVRRRSGLDTSVLGLRQLLVASRNSPLEARVGS